MRRREFGGRWSFACTVIVSIANDLQHGKLELTGAAHSALKYMTWRVEAGTAVVCLSHSSSDLISTSVDMIAVLLISGCERVSLSSW